MPDKTVEGVVVSGYGCEALALDLERYCEISPTARDHVALAGRRGVRVVVQRSGRICHAEQSVVKISRDACLDAATGLTSPVYMAESVLFEVQNAINSPRYQQLRRQVKGGQISVLQYGVGMSNVEFESTAKIAAILTEVKSAGEPLSAWGEKQFLGVAMGAVGFANNAHDPAAAGAQRLPSKLFYVYEYLQDQVKEVKNMKIAALKKVASIRKGARSIKAFEWGQIVARWGTQYAATTPANFLVSYIDALRWLDNERDFSVTWEGGTKADWKVCSNELVRIVPGVSVNRHSSEAIKKDLQAARYR